MIQLVIAVLAIATTCTLALAGVYYAGIAVARMPECQTSTVEGRSCYDLRQQNRSRQSAF